jgi:hypothetical protein
MKKFNKKLILILPGLLISSYIIAQETYEYKVRLGESLSHILNRFFPKDKIYGQGGKIDEVVKMNASIKDKNLIFPDQVVNLPIYSNVESSKIEVSDATSEEEKYPLEKIVAKELSYPIAQELSFNVAVLFGAKLIDYSQKGFLGQASIQGVLFNYLKLETEFCYGDWKTEFSADTFKIGYKISTSQTQDSLYNFRLASGRSFYFVSVGKDELPLVNDNTALISFSKQSLFYVGLGVTKEMTMPFVRPVSFEVKSEIRYPLTTSIKSSQFKSSSLRGYYLLGQGNFKLELSKNDKYSLFSIWANNLSYQKVSQNIVLSDLSGKVDSKMTTVSSSLGLQLDF